MTAWRTTTIGDQVTLQRGIDITREQQRPGRVPVVSSGGVGSFHDIAAAKGPGVILGRKGVVGSVYYVAGDYWPHDTTLWVKDFKANFPRFVYYFFRHRARMLASLDVGSANPTLNRNHVHPTIVEWPPIPEQRAIARILGALDDKIELNRRTNETLEAMARALFQSWFVDFDPVRAKMEGRQPEGMDAETAKLFPNKIKESGSGSIPAAWAISTVADLCVKVESGGTPSRSRQEYWTPSEVPWLTSGEVRQPLITETSQYVSNLGLDCSNAKIWPRGTTIVAMYGATAAQVTLAGTEMAANQACCGLIPRPASRAYVYWALRESNGRLAGMARGSAQQNLSLGLVSSLSALRPSTELLAAFEASAGARLDAALASQFQSRTLTALRDALLPKLLSGELRVPEAERAVSEVL